jgi:hypothetical protein
MIYHLRSAVSVIVAMGTLSLFANLAHTEAPRPNVLLIYTDDHSQWAVGSYGNQEVHTPHMDQLVADGMQFTRGFTKAVCSPSRAMVLTGLYSHRVGIPDFIPHGNPVVSGNGLPPGTSTIATVLKQAGYRTGLIGKWHLGYGENFYPQKFGFDVADGFRYIAPDKEIRSVGKIPFLLDGKEVPRFRYDKQHTDILTDRAIKFIENRGEQPFFLYLSIYLPHLPWEAIPDEDRKHYEGKKLIVPNLSRQPEEAISEDDLRELMRSYYANISCADRNIGRVLSTLDSLDLTKNTLVFFHRRQRVQRWTARIARKGQRSGSRHEGSQAKHVRRFRSGAFCRAVARGNRSGINQRCDGIDDRCASHLNRDHGDENTIAIRWKKHAADPQEPARREMAE